MAYLLACFIIALIIYFGVYYEKDKKAREQRGKPRPGRHDEEFIIFPFFDEKPGRPEKHGSDSTGADAHFHGDHFED